MLDNKCEKILAKSLFREFRTRGYSANQVLDVAIELLDLVTEDIHETNARVLAERWEGAASKGGGNDRLSGAPEQAIH